ncbi:MAG: HNH endonuclease [Clostridium sp.]|nr:HNH endonuclease [Clostridium sp.]
MNSIKSERWRRLRAVILRRDGYQCQLSKRYGKTVEAEMVHHIFPRDEFPEYTWEPWNLISLSQEQHNTLHDRTTGQLTPAGVELLKRTARRNGIPVPLHYQ